ncbi:MAG TPA: hypothetical protein VMW67_00635 [Desulfobacteria bacterium]|nr:hypothetical protein [Desulfobacteria bacterium]
MRKVWNWIGNNDKQIQVILVLALVGVTMYYAVSTHKMASTMKNDFEANNRPFVFVSDILVDSGTSSIGVVLENSGKLPAAIEFKRGDIIFYQTPFTELGRKDLAEDINITYFVFPTQKNEKISIPASEIMNNISESDGFLMQIMLDYWEINNPKNKRKYHGIVNYYTGKNNTEGFIWDIQIIEAD